MGVSWFAVTRFKNWQSCFGWHVDDVILLANALYPQVTEIPFPAFADQFLANDGVGSCDAMGAHCVSGGLKLSGLELCFRDSDLNLSVLLCAGEFGGSPK